MPKYDPLHHYLRRRRGTEIRLTFADIERIIAGLLPKAAGDDAWWTNTPARARGFVQCRAWLDAGYHAQPILGGEEAVRFVPINPRSMEV